MIARQHSGARGGGAATAIGWAVALLFCGWAGGLAAAPVKGRLARVGGPRPPVVAPVAVPPVDPPAVPVAVPVPLPGGESVAVFEYRNDVKQFVDLSERLSLALRQNTSLGVVTAVEARRQLGAGIEAEVAACDGEPRCLGAVGERLKVTEVLLLAVSQLGDVVLALQRINVAQLKVVSRFADSLPSGTMVDDLRLLSWLQQLYPPETFKRYGQIRITTDVAGAQVYVNTKPRGQTPLGEPLSVLAPGNYRLLVEKDRYQPFQASLTVMPDSTVEVDARLLKISQQQPWYRRWYVWAGIGAGLAAVAATGVAIHFATLTPAPDISHVPGTIVFQ